MVTMALLCERQPRIASAAGALADFCGVCRNCTRVAESADLEARVAEAIAAREEMRDADKKDTRILVPMAATLLLSALSFHLFESPMRALLRRLLGRRLAPHALAT